MCNFGRSFLVSSLQIFTYTTCFGLIGHFQVHNLVCRSFKVTAAGSFLGWRCAAVHMFPIYGFRWSDFLSLATVWGSLGVFVFSGLNSLSFVGTHQPWFYFKGTCRRNGPFCNVPYRSVYTARDISGHYGTSEGLAERMTYSWATERDRRPLIYALLWTRKWH
jgi:hypothetical protein